MKIAVKTISLCLLFAFVIFCPSFIRGYFFKEEPSPKRVILSLWHVDTFEGGTGSRQDFLAECSTGFSKIRQGVTVSIIKHTEESIETAFREGYTPDIISFGIGVDGVLERAKPLKSHKNNVFFTSAEIGGTAYYYPWAYGKYVKLKLNGSKAETYTASKGRNNFALFASVKMQAECSGYLSPIEAYAELLSGRSKLVGTQRDVYRLRNREMDYQIEGSCQFTDLVQYVAVTATDIERVPLAMDFCEYVLSDSVQERLYTIGMFSPTGVAIDYGFSQMNALSKQAPKEVLSPFIDRQKRKELLSQDGQNDFFEKFNEYVRF